MSVSVASEIVAQAPTCSAAASKRIAWVDFVKGVGILLVVFGHVWRGCANAGLAIDPVIYAAVDRAVYLFHMPLFFFLAGLFFADAVWGRSLKHYVFSRAEQLILPLILWSYLSAVFRGLAGGAATRGGLSLQEILFYPFAANDIYWFLWALFLIQVALAGAVRAPGPAGHLLLAGLVSVSFAVVAAGLSIPVIGTALHFLPYLALGYAARHAACWRFGPAAGLVGAAAFIAAEIFGLMLYPSGLSVLLVASIALLGFTAALAALEAQFTTSTIVRAVTFLGRRSMPIYLVHVIAFAGARAVAMRLGVAAFGPHLVIGCLAGVLVPLALDRLASHRGWGVALGFAPLSRRLRTRVERSAPTSI